MKKKFLSMIALVALLATSLIVLAGCAADNKESSSNGGKKESFYELKYDEPKGYASVLDFGGEDNKTKNYVFGEADGSISINYKKGKGYAEVEESFYDEHTEKEINGTTWRVMSNEDLGVKSYFYYVVHNDDLYLIELNGVDKFKDNMLDFINTLSFK